MYQIAYLNENNFAALTEAAQRKLRAAGKSEQIGRLARVTMPLIWELHGIVPGERKAGKSGQTGRLARVSPIWEIPGTEANWKVGKSWESWESWASWKSWQNYWW